MRPALEQVCAKQTLSARKLFFHANLVNIPLIKNVEETQSLWVHRPRGLTDSNFPCSQMADSDFPCGQTRFFFRKSPMRSGSPYTSTQKMHRPGSCSPLHFDVGNTWQIRTEKWISNAQRFLSTDMLERWPYDCRVKITCTILPTNRFDSNEWAMSHMNL